MRDLKSTRWMWIKAGLFIIIALVSSALILVQDPDWHIAILLVAAIWAFCRIYYFAFYVIEKYIDPSFKFSGLFSVVRYLWEKK